MANTENVTQQKSNKSSREVKIAVVALFVFAILLSISFFIFFNNRHQEEPDSINNNEYNESLNAQSEEPDNHVENTDEEPDENIHEDHQEDLNDDFISDIDINKDQHDETLTEQFIMYGPEPQEITGVAYLTFDDGPSREITPGILDILSEERIKATFFVLPRDEVDDIFMRIIDEGHEIGNHSYSHNFRRLYNTGIDAFKNDIQRAHDHLHDNFGYTATAFRFPGGSMSWRRDAINQRIVALEEMGYIYFDWHIDSGDAYAAQIDKSAQALADNVINEMNSREHVIILLHDFRWRQSTLDALPIIISGLREQGYIFDIISNYPG